LQREAAAAFRRTVEADPDDAVTWKSLALTCYELHDLNNFRAAGQRAAALGPDIVPMWMAAALPLL
jgi:hypothetical protein